jgi:DNA-binding HxlR family transcriptional regulator
MEREVAGISTKVLNERLRKLVRLGIVERRAYPEIPPRVEYRLSRFGRRFTRILDAVESLQQELGELRYPPRP